MNNEDLYPKPIPGPKTSTYVIYALLALVLVLAATVVWLSVYRMAEEPVEVMDAIAVDSVEPIQEQLDSSFLVTGNLYFTGKSTTDMDTPPQVWRYSFEENRAQVYISEPTIDFVTTDTEFDLLIAHLGEESPTSGYQPVWRDRETGEIGILPHQDANRGTDIAVSPDNRFYAYSYQVDIVDDIDNLANWEIAIHNYETGEVIVIPEAAEPIWFSNSRDVLFMAADGLYVYDLETEQEFPLYTNFSDLQAFDDMALSLDDSTIVLTIPVEGLIVILDLEIREDGEEFVVTVRDTVSQPGALWRHPVIAPGNDFYAVYVGVEEGDVSDQAIIEIRSFDHDAVIQTVTYPGFDPYSIKLTHWSI